MTEEQESLINRCKEHLELGNEILTQYIVMLQKCEDMERMAIEQHNIKWMGMPGGWCPPDCRDNQ